MLQITFKHPQKHCEETTLQIISLHNFVEQRCPFCLSRPMRGSEKPEPPQPMLPGVHREQQRPPHLHPPPPHRAWEQLGQLYDSHLPPQGHTAMPFHNEPALRLNNGGYLGSAGLPLNTHHLSSRPNQQLKVNYNAMIDFIVDIICKVDSFSEIIEV